MANIDSVLGAGLIVAGLYFVLWGKSKEMKAQNLQPIPSTNSGELLDHAHDVEIAISPPESNKDLPKDGKC